MSAVYYGGEKIRLLNILYIRRNIVFHQGILHVFGDVYLIEFFGRVFSEGYLVVYERGIRGRKTYGIMGRGSKNRKRSKKYRYRTFNNIQNHTPIQNHISTHPPHIPFLRSRKKHFPSRPSTYVGTLSTYSYISSIFFYPSTIFTSYTGSGIVPIRYVRTPYVPSESGRLP